MSSLRVLFGPPASGPENMAVDTALLEEAAAGIAPPTLRLYRWRGPWVSIGYAQDLAVAVNLETCAGLGAGVVRRPTGGKALLHGSDLTYGLVLPAGHRLARHNVARSYRAISVVLTDALALLGMDVRLARTETGRGPRVLACFEEHRVETVIAGGRKLIGSAQARRRGALLQHGVVPLTCDYATQARLFAPPGSDLAAHENAHRARVTCLSEAAPGVSLEMLAAALVAAFSRAIGPGWPGELTERERRAADRLRVEFEMGGQVPHL